MEVLQILAGIGDGATILIAYGFWKLDRRLLKLEMKMGFTKQ